VIGAWRAEYHAELLGASRSAALEQQGRREAEERRRSGALWVLTVGGEIVAMTGFNAEARGIAQVGGVYTPPERRGRGYARAAVAGSLELARQRGVRPFHPVHGRDQPGRPARLRRLGVPGNR